MPAAGLGSISHEVDKRRSWLRMACSWSLEATARGCFVNCVGGASLFQ